MAVVILQPSPDLTLNDVAEVLRKRLAPGYQITHDTMFQTRRQRFFHKTVDIVRVVQGGWLGASVRAFQHSDRTVLNIFPDPPSHAAMILLGYLLPLGLLYMLFAQLVVRAASRALCPPNWTPETQQELAPLAGRNGGPPAAYTGLAGFREAHPVVGPPVEIVIDSIRTLAGAAAFLAGANFIVSGWYPLFWDHDNAANWVHDDAWADGLGAILLLVVGAWLFYGGLMGLLRRRRGWLSTAVATVGVPLAVFVLGPALSYPYWWCYEPICWQDYQKNQDAYGDTALHRYNYTVPLRFQRAAALPLTERYRRPAIATVHRDVPAPPPEPAPQQPAPTPPAAKEKQILDSSADQGFLTPDGKVLAAAAVQSHKVRLINTASNEDEVIDSEGGIIAFAPNGKWLVTVNVGNTMRDESRFETYLTLYDVAKREKAASSITAMKQQSFPVNALTPDGKTLITGDGDDLILVDVHTGEVRRPFEGLVDPITLAVSRDGARLAAAFRGRDKEPMIQFCVWDLATLKQERCLEGLKPVQSVAFSADGKLLAAGGGAAIKVWDLAANKVVQTLQIENKGDYVMAVALGRDGTVLVSATNGGTVAVWDVTSGKPLYSFEIWESHPFDPEKKSHDSLDKISLSDDAEVLWVKGLSTRTVYSLADVFKK